MKIKSLFLSLLFIGATITVSAQTEIRPYQEWNETAFVSVKTHQPANYVRPDNNWDILYTLRTPYTQAELNSMGIPCTKSQLMLLEIGGLIEKEGKKWHTVVPILDKSQTDGLRAYSKQVADKVYTIAKSDFQLLMKEIDKMGFKDNTASLIFSYLLDGQMWTELVLFEEINNHATWSGCYWLLYDYREGLEMGTNTYGNSNLVVTYGVTSEIVPGHQKMREYAKEIAEYGKIVSEEYIRELQPYGLTDDEGNLLIPIIKKEENDFHRLIDVLKTTISTGMKNNVGTLLADYGIKNEKLGIVILYHEVMWDIIDLLIKEQGLVIPEIVKDGKTDKTQLKNVSFFVEDGLFQ